MCYSAQIWSDFHKYERFGGALNVKEFVKLFWERRKSGDYTRKIPKAVKIKGVRFINCALIDLRRRQAMLNK